MLLPFPLSGTREGEKSEVKIDVYSYGHRSVWRMIQIGVRVTTLGVVVRQHGRNMVLPVLLLGAHAAPKQWLIAPKSPTIVSVELSGSPRD